jgi:glutamine amidotransferase
MIAVIDVSGNNLASLANALNRLDVPWQMTHEPDTLKRASHVILPGVGTASQGMRALREHNLVDVIRQLTQPLLGICLGMQLLLESSEEGDEPVACLGLIPGHVKRFPKAPGFPVPHMGWNRLHWHKESYLSQGLTQQEHVYFVHGYALFTQENTLASCQYSEPFSAIVQRGPVIGMQFHPEKSAETGLTLLRNFINQESSCY